MFDGLTFLVGGIALAGIIIAVVMIRNASQEKHQYHLGDYQIPKEGEREQPLAEPPKQDPHLRRIQHEEDEAIKRGEIED